MRGVVNGILMAGGLSLKCVHIRAQNGGPQSSNLKQQNPTRLTGSKRATTDECLNENVNNPQKKQRESCPTETQKIERSAVSAKQHRREQ